MIYLLDNSIQKCCSDETFCHYVHISSGEEVVQKPHNFGIEQYKDIPLIQTTKNVNYFCSCDVWPN